VPNHQNAAPPGLLHCTYFAYYSLQSKPMLSQQMSLPQGKKSNIGLPASPTHCSCLSTLQEVQAKPHGRGASSKGQPPPEVR